MLLLKTDLAVLLTSSVKKVSSVTVNIRKENLKYHYTIVQICTVLVFGILVIPFLKKMEKIQGRIAKIRVIVSERGKSTLKVLSFKKNNFSGCGDD